MKRLFIALGAAALVVMGALAVTASGQTQNCTGPDYCPIPAQTTSPKINVLGLSGGKFSVPKSARGKGRTCAAKNFTFTANANTKNPLAFAHVFVDNRLIKSTKSKHIVARVNVKKLHPGVHILKLTVKDAIGLVSKRFGRFSVCARSAALPSRTPGFTG
jgi:hypothetical protein